MNEERPLTETHPELCKEWSERNFPFLPQDETERSYSKVWWRCKNGHEWYATVYNRATLIRHTGCPYCSGREIYKGFNDLESQYPHLLKEWDYEANGDLKPNLLHWHSSTKVQWICEKGHRWVTAVVNRSKGNGCPVCAQEKVISGVNDLATTHPKLAEEWSDRNFPLKSNMVRAYYRKQVWWKCKDCGGEYFCQVLSRTYYDKKGCPYCSGRQVKVGFNDLATTHPELVAEWDYERNGNCKPTDVTGQFTKYIWWKCKEGHKWGTTIKDRVEKFVSCPVCRGEVLELEDSRIEMEEGLPNTQLGVKKPKMLRRILEEEVNEVYTSIPTLQWYTNYAKHQNNFSRMKEVPPWEKYALPLGEASQYFSISIIKLRKLINSNKHADFLIWQGGYVFIVREAFEKYLNDLTEFEVKKL